MQFDTIFMAVAHPKAGVAVGTKTSKGDFFEAVDHLLLFCIRRCVLTGKTDDTSAVAPLVGTCINQINHAVRVATHDFRHWFAGH